MNHNVKSSWSAKLLVGSSIALSIFIVGLLLLVAYNSYHQTRQLHQRVAYRVNLSPDTSDSLAHVLLDTIENFTYVRSADYISKERAAQIFQEEIGSDFVQILGYNPLFATIVVHFQPQRVPELENSNIAHFTKSMKQFPFVSGVDYEKNVANKIGRFYFDITWFLVVILGVVGLVCGILILMSVRMAMLPRRSFIQTQRLLGASNAFVLRPVIVHGCLYGLFGGLAGLALLVGTLLAFRQPQDFALLPAEFNTHLLYLAAALLALSVLASLAASIISAMRFMRH